MIKTNTLSGLILLVSATLLRGAEGGADVNADTLKRAEERWGKHLVPVAVWLKRSEGEDPSGFSMSRRMQSFSPTRRSPSLELPYSEKRPAEMAGLAVDAHTIWIPDLGLETRFVSKVEVGSPALPAVLQGTCLAASVWIVQTKSPLPGIEPIAFDAGANATELLGIHSTYTAGGWTFAVAPIAPQLRKLGGTIWIDTDRSGAFLVTKDLKAAGYTGSGKLGVENAPYPWRGSDVAASPVLEFSAATPNNPELIQKLDSSVLTVRGFYRSEVEADESENHRFRMRRFMREDESQNELMTSGYAVSPKLVLVNHGLSRENAQRLERVSVVVGGEERPARFVGAFRRFNSFLVEIEGEPLKDPLDLASAEPFMISQPLIALTADHASKARRARVTLNRVTNIERGYRNVVEPVLQHFPRPGTIFLGAEDRSVRGVILDVRRDTSADDPNDYRSTSGIDLRLMAPAELKALLAEGKAAYDPRLLPRSAEREKDMVWLGVDFQPLTPELAKSHGVEIATRGGELGVIVLKVHADSPAARMGVVPDDIILSIRDDEEPEPWEITMHGGFDREDDMDFQLPDDIPEEMQEEFFAQSGPPWRSPRNTISDKLTGIGEGKKVEISYLHEGKETSGTITLELGPPDFESAKKFKSEDIGLTVKELTYEVRGHFRLKPDAPGVVVAKVERGSKAAVAKVMPFEVLSSINGKAVRSVDQLQTALAEAKDKDGGDNTIELRLERLGKSRLVRIR